MSEQFRPKSSPSIAMLLPVRPRPEPGEATMGYLMRLAEANGHATPKYLWHGLKSSMRLFDAIGLNKEESKYLFGPLPGYWGTEPISGNAKGQGKLSVSPHLGGLNVSDFNHSHLRWCPLCLMESNWIRGIWLLKLCTVCTEHKIALHETCSRCGEIQPLEKAHVGQCHTCYTKLTVGAIRSAAPNLVCISRLLENGRKQDKDVSNDSAKGLPMLDIRQWHKLALYLGQFTLDAQPTKPGQIAGLHQLETATHLMSNLAYLLEQWPNNFHQVLASLQKKQAGNTSLHRTFGKLMHVLYKQLHEPCFRFLRTAFERYVQQNWPGMLSQRNRYFKKKTVAKHPRITVKQASAILNTPKSILLHALKQQPELGYQVQSAKGRHIRTLPTSLVGGMASHYKQHTLTLADVADSLEIPKKRVKTLIDNGFIKPLFNRNQVGAASWLIPSKQLKRFWYSPKPITEELQTIQLAKILQNWKLTAEEFVAMIAALTTKELEPLGEEQLQPVSLGKVVLSKQDFQNWLSTRRFKSSGYLSIDQAAKQLGLKQQVAYGLVHNKLLETASDGRSLTGQKITAASLEKFKATYISLAVIAKAQGCSPRKLLHEINAQPVCGPQVDGMRQYFYRRTEIA